MSKQVYLDSAATTILAPEVIESMVSVMKTQYANPSSSYAMGRDVRFIMEDSRKKIAAFVCAYPSEIVFTSGGTEANNLIIQSCIRDLKVNHIVTSTIEHKAVLETVCSLALKSKSLKVTFVPLDEVGSVKLDALETILQTARNHSDKTLVSLMHANNEIGNLLEIQNVVRLCKEKGAYFHSDTVQTVGHYQVDFNSIGLDFASCSAHKIHGPKGVGFAYIRKASGLRPIIMGGGQERSMRAGTENVYGIVGMQCALALAYNHLDNEVHSINELKQYAIEQLKTHIPGIGFNGLSAAASNKALYTLLSIRLPFKDEMISFKFDLNGIALSQGSACSSGAAKGSHVIQQILPDSVLEHSTNLRISFSRYNTKQDVDRFVSVLRQILEKQGEKK